MDLLKKIRNLDWFLLVPVLLLIFLGFGVIYSAGGGPGTKGFSYASKQLLWAGVSMFSFVIILYFGFPKFMEWSYWLYLLALILLAIVLILGASAKGAQSWLGIGPFRLQPSEFGKISLALVLSRHLCRYPPDNLSRFLSGLAVASPAALLVLVQPDLGSTLVYCFMVLVALIVAGSPCKYICTLLGCVAGMMPFAWTLLKEYQKLRLMVFLNPSVDPLGAGYNVIQSRIAVGSGGFWGRGFLAGLQSKLHFLPEPHTDFIFSVFAEEFGFVGAIILLALFALLFWRMVYIAIRAKDLRAKIFIAMVSAWIWFQTVESIGMSMGILPITGLPLPFMSYGGSSLLSILISVGLISSISLSSVKKYE